MHVFSQLFLLFKLERRNLGAQGHFKFSVAHGHFKFSVAHGHFRISVAHGQFKFSVARGHIKFSVAMDIREKKTFDIILKLHEPGSMEIGQN